MKYSAFVSLNKRYIFHGNDNSADVYCKITEPTFLATLKQTSGSGANNSARVYHYHLSDDKILGVDLI